MATIDKRGDFQWRARVRRNGKAITKTHESFEAAERWALELEGKVVGDEYQDRTQARGTTLSQACDWYADLFAPRSEESQKRRAKTGDDRNKLSRLTYWQASEFSGWSLVSLKPADLLRWRRKVLDEDNAEDDGIGPDAEVGSQTVVHRLNTLSQVFARWALAHNVTLINPVVRGVRPSLPDGRNRRLDEGEEGRLLDAAAKSSRPWLRAAVIVAIETCMRQSELAGLTWDRVRLGAQYPHADLPKTKNDRPRRVPLSLRAVAAFESLRPAGAIGAIGKTPVLPVETGRGVAHAFRDAVTDEAFPDLRWHDLRHEGISRLFELTDLRDNEIMAISGHLRAEMLTRYTHLRADRLGARLPGGALHRS